MNKKLVTSLMVACSVLVVGACTMPTIIASLVNVKSKNNSNDSTNNNNTNNEKLLLPSVIDGKYVEFDSIDHAKNSIYSNSKIYPTSYIGDFNSALNPNNNSIDPNRGVYEYKSSNILDAFKTAKGQYTSNRLEATESYLWDSSNQYMDANGYLYENLSDAQTANDEYNRKQTIGVSYYKIKDLSNNKTYNINPLNNEDVDYFKKIAIRNLGLENSQFTISPIVIGDDGQMNSIDVMSNFSRDTIVTAMYELLEYLFTQMSKVRYSANISLTDYEAPIENWFYIERKHNWMGGSADYLYEAHKSDTITQFDSRYSIGSVRYYFKYSCSLNSGLTFNEGYHDEKGFKIFDVPAGDFNDVFGAFIDTNTFANSFSIVPEVRLNHLPSSCLWDDAAGCRYELTEAYRNKFAKYLFPNFKNITFDQYNEFDKEKDYTFRISVNYDGLSNIESYRFQTSLMKRETKLPYTNRLGNVEYFSPSGNFYNIKSFVVDGTSDISALNNAETKSSIVDNISRILYKNLIFKNPDIVSILPDIPLINQIKTTVDNLANSVFNTWTKTLENWTLYQDSEFLLNFASDFEQEFTNNKYNTYTKEALLNTITQKSWWVNKLQNDNFFDNIVSVCSNLVNNFTSEVHKNALLINFNNAPIFMISDLSPFNIEAVYKEPLSSIESKVKKWALDKEYDPNLLENVSNKIDFLSKIGYFVIRSGARNITTINPDATNNINEDLLRFNISLNDYTLQELNQGQSLLLSSADITETLRNDLGVQSALWLYNKNIDKVLGLSNRDVYIENINEDTIVNPNNVLRLYNKIDTKYYSGDFKDAQHTYPMYYGEIRSRVGTFNPSIHDTYVMAYKSEVDRITSDIVPLEVPVVRINGVTYILARLANPDAAIITGNIQELIIAASRRLVQYMYPSDLYVFYNQGTTANPDLILINNTIQQVVKYDLNIGLIDPVVFDYKTTLLFSESKHGDAYIYDKIRTNAVYKK